MSVALKLFTANLRIEKLTRRLKKMRQRRDAWKQRAYRAENSLYNTDADTEDFDPDAGSDQE